MVFARLNGTDSSLLTRPEADKHRLGNGTGAPRGKRPSQREHHDKRL
jgi:hypothetical protein